MYGSLASALIKDIKRNGDELGPHSEHTVHAICKESKRLFSEITETLEREQFASQFGSAGKIHILHATLKHNRRCLVAYTLRRIQLIRKHFDSLCNSADRRSLLSKAELSFFQQAQALLQSTLFDAYPSLNWNVNLSTPPSCSSHVMVKVIERDIGEIVTENGTLVLTYGSILNILKEEVEGLIRLGYVEVIGESEIS